MSSLLLNNRYQIVSTLARGGFGETFLAVDTYLPSSKKCVIKQLKPLVATTDELPDWLKERFQKEAAILEELGNKHGQIPKLYAYFSEGDNFYLVQEWVEGMTLTQLWRLNGNFTEEEVERLLIDLLPVLDYIHSRHIIHRDIKPDNIIIRESDNKPVLIDFGIIKETIGTQYNDGRVSSVVLGTPGYMSAEQAAGRPVYSSDLYSLGLTAVFLLSGKNPEQFPCDQKTGEIIWRNSLNDLHSDLMMVLEKAIRFHPRDRFSSAREMLLAIEQIPSLPTIRNTSTKVVSPLVEEESTGSRFSIWSWLLLLTASVSAFVLGFVLVSLQSRFNNNSTPQPTPLPSSVDFSPRPLYTPSPSPTPEVTPRRRVRRTPIPEVTPTPIPTPSETPTPFVTPTPIPSETPTPIPSETPIPSVTPIPDISPLPTPDTSPTPQSF